MDNEPKYSGGSPGRGVTLCCGLGHWGEGSVSSASLDEEVEEERELVVPSPTAAQVPRGDVGWSLTWGAFHRLGWDGVRGWVQGVADDGAEGGRWWR